MRSLWHQLRDRGVIKIGLTYLVGAWLVLQLADVIFPAMGLPETSVAFALGILIVGFPLVLALAWVFDVTPEGIRRTEPQPVGHSAAQVAEGASIAVVPFPDMSAEKDQEHFCDGLTEELLNVLTRIPDLRVASRTSSFSLKGRTVDLAEIAQRFNVAHVLEGSVRKSGDRIRVTAQLIEAATDSHLWSETYDRELDDIFAIQDDIAARVLAALELKLGAGSSAYADTSNTRAYEYYLRGRGHLLARSAQGTRIAGDMFRKAVELDPDFARAWINLAEVSAMHAVYFGNPAHWQEVAREAADRLTELVPDRAESYLARGYAFIASGQFDEAEYMFDKVLALSPELAIAHYYQGRARVHQGNLVAAGDAFAEAARLDADDFESAVLGCMVLSEVGENESATALARMGVERAERNIENYPDNPRAYYLGAGALQYLGEIERGFEWTERALELGREDGSTRYNCACFYAKAGEIDKALDCLEDSVTGRTWIENDPDLNALRDHPRYRAIIDALPD